MTTTNTDPTRCESCGDPATTSDEDFDLCAGCADEREDLRQDADAAEAPAEAPEPCECCEEPATLVRYDCLSTRYVFCAAHGRDDYADILDCPEKRERCACLLPAETLLVAATRAAFVRVAVEEYAESEEIGHEETARYVTLCRTASVDELLVLAGQREV